MVAQTLRPGMDEAQLAELFVLGEQLGLKFELTDSGITWETYPGVEHQRLIYGIQTSLDSHKSASGQCGCHHVADVDIVFPDGTVKRPDISIWCEWPKELEGFVHEIPEAVIEVVSPGYEGKDLVQGPPIYLRNGVKDVIVLHRQAGEVHHWNSSGHKVLATATVFDLECGCRVTV